MVCIINPEFTCFLLFPDLILYVIIFQLHAPAHAYGHCPYKEGFYILPTQTTKANTKQVDIHTCQTNPKRTKIIDEKDAYLHYFCGEIPLQCLWQRVCNSNLMRRRKGCDTPYHYSL